MLRRVSNPPNPWRTNEVEYLEEIPETRLETFRRPPKAGDQTELF